MVLGETTLSISSSSSSLPEKNTVSFLKKSLSYFHKATHFYEKMQNWSALLKTFDFIKITSWTLYSKLSQINSNTAKYEGYEKYLEIFQAAEATIIRLNELIKENKTFSCIESQVLI